MKRGFARIYDFYFHHMKLKSKFMLSHLILALAPSLVIAFFCYNQLFRIITQNTLQSLQAISAQTVTSIENTMAHMESVATSVQEQDFLSSYLKNDSLTALYGDARFQEELRAFVESTNYLCSDDTIAAIRIYVDDSHYELAETYAPGIFAPMKKAMGTYWYGIFSGTGKDKLYCPSMYLSPNEIDAYGELAVIHKLPLSSKEKDFAYVAVYFSQDMLDATLQQHSPFTNSVIYLMNERDAIVSTSNAALSGLYYLPYDNVKESIPSPLKFETLTIMDTKIYMGYKYVPGTDWYMITAIPVSNVFEEGNTLLIQFLSIYVLILVAGCAISLLLSNSIVKRISSVINRMKDVRSKAPVHLEIDGGMDEIGVLVDTYNYMTDEINSLMQKQSQAANDLRVSEFKALQSQINPHFLYNTLDMINWMAKSGKSEEVSEAVQVLSRFYKLTLSKGNEVVTVKDELEHVSLYVKIQNMRYQDKIHFFIDVPDEMMEFEIPKLVFQPIVENSIQHGIFEKDSKEGNIVIMGWQEEETLVFVVSDDGVGISPETLSHLLDGTGKSQSGSNVGIYNTHRRLQLYYDSQFGLSYRSEPNQDTEVEIRIPSTIKHRQL